MTTTYRLFPASLMLMPLVFFLMIGMGVSNSHGNDTPSWFTINAPGAHSDWRVIPVPRRSLNTPGTQPELHEHGNPTNFEQWALERINASRANPGKAAGDFGVALNQGLPPGTISSSPKPPLAFNPRLIDAARGHSGWMLATQKFSHTGRGGSTPKVRVAGAGYVLTGTWSCAENIGWSGTTGPFNPEQHLRNVLRELFRSPGHRVNTLAENLDEIGIGIFTGRMMDFNSVMVTEKYAGNSARMKPLLLGVVFNDINGNGMYDPGEGIEGVTLFLNNGAYFAVSSASGGFAIPLHGLDGRATLIATGEGVPGFVVRNVNLKDHNIKVDLDISRLSPQY